MAVLTELVSVQEWMSGVELKLSPDKTGFFIVMGGHARRVTCGVVPEFPVRFLQGSVAPADKNLAGKKSRCYFWLGRHL